MKHLLLILFLPMIFNISLMGQDKSEQDRQKDILDCLVKMMIFNERTLAMNASAK